MTTSPDELLQQYQGQIVPKSYSPGFIALSYIISLIGAASTLELINRRTGFKGIFNNVLLVGSAVTMGGVAIWSMHFIGNRAIVLGGGEGRLQIMYSAGFTVLSLFVPIIVLIAAFMALGGSTVVSWWRILISGVLCGCTVCGMHYLGNASIANYSCQYDVANVVGAGVISVAASFAALSMFFVFRAMWANSWWKRIVSAIILAGAVSGMHWCAAVGTRYKLLSITSMDNSLSRNTTVIVVICLAVSACLVLAGSVVFRARNRGKSAQRAQQVTLGAAVFDSHGRILVDPDGLIPSTVVTDSFLEKHTKEYFGTAHPLFHWMFQASRCWNGIASLVGGMGHHLNSLPRSTGNKDGRHGIELINEYGELVDDYDVIFRELFCVAAATLTEQLKERVTSAGILWDEILPTGSKRKRPEPQPAKLLANNRISGKDAPRADANSVHSDLTEKEALRWQQEYGRGSLMFLVRRVKTEQEAARLTSAGFLFADVHQVGSIIRSRMQIMSPRFEEKLRQMAAYGEKSGQLEGGVHLGFFAIRARVNSSGFEVMVQKSARNLLPSVSLGIAKLEAWHYEFLDRFIGMSVTSLLKALGRFSSNVPREQGFGSKLLTMIRELQASIQDELFDDAVLVPGATSLPLLEENGTAETRELVSFRLVIPVHSILRSPNCDLVPLSFFKVQQMSPKQELAFTQGVHREFGAIVKGAAAAPQDKSRRSTRNWIGRRTSSMASTELTKIVHLKPDGDNKVARVSERELWPKRPSHSSSTVNLCPPDGGSDVSSQIERTPAGNTEYSADEISPYSQAQPYSGILVSQEITVDVQPADESNAGSGSRGRRTSVDAAGRTRDASSKTFGVELKTLPRVGNDFSIYSRQLGPSMAQPGHGQEPATFVDALFAQCMHLEGR